MKFVEFSTIYSSFKILLVQLRNKVKNLKKI